MAEVPLFRPVKQASSADRPSVRNLLAQPNAGTSESIIAPAVHAFDLALDCKVVDVPSLLKSLEPRVHPAHLKLPAPILRHVHGLQKFQMEIQVEGWKFPNPAITPVHKPMKEKAEASPITAEEHILEMLSPSEEKPTRQKPPATTVILKERLLTLLQPPLENIFAGKKIELPFKPFPYQMEGISFLMPRHGALLADEMGLGKTMQCIVSLRLLLHSQEVRRALIVCPKPLVPTWLNELKMWAPDVPVEVIVGDSVARRVACTASNSPLKLVNYDLLTRDAALALATEVARRDPGAVAAVKRAMQGGRAFREGLATEGAGFVHVASTSAAIARLRAFAAASDERGTSTPWRDRTWLR